jgi:hypothetical protein
MRDEMIRVKKHQTSFLTKGRGIERELLDAILVQLRMV